MAPAPKYKVGDKVWLAEFDNGTEIVPREEATIVGVQATRSREVMYTGIVKPSGEGDDGFREFSEDQIERLAYNRPCSCGSGEPSWWEHDAQNIPLCRVCDDCRAQKLAHYRPEILRGYDQSDVDEPIEPEDYHGRRELEGD